MRSLADLTRSVANQFCYFFVILFHGPTCSISRFLTRNLFQKFWIFRSDLFVFNFFYSLQYLVKNLMWLLPEFVAQIDVQEVHWHWWEPAARHITKSNYNWSLSKIAVVTCANKGIVVVTGTKKGTVHYFSKTQNVFRCEKKGKWYL